MSDVFTLEEVNLICIFSTGNRPALITELLDASTDFEDDELLDIAISVLDKLARMTDEDFEALNFSPEYGDYDIYDELEV